MAAPMKEADSNRGKLEDEALDLSSPSFDPLRALYSRRVQLPCPNIVPLNNIAEYVSYSEGKSRRQRRKQTDTVTVKDDEKSKSRDIRGVHRQKCGSEQNTTSQNDNAHEFTKATTGNDGSDDKRKIHRNHRNVLTKMEGYKRGPLSLLQRCVNEKVLIQVWIRSAVDLRGMCKGYLVAFDKHFNLAMIDVDELYRCPISKEIQQRKDNKRERRRLKQLKDQMAKLSVTEQPSTTTDVSVRTSVNKEECENKPISSSLLPEETMSPQTKLTQTSLDKDFTEVQPVKNVEVLDKSRKDLPKVTEKIDSDSSNKQDQIDEQAQSDEPSTSLPCEQDPATSSEQDPISSREEPASHKSPLPFRERHVNQLFIRGDNVVSIMLLE